MLCWPDIHIYLSWVEGTLRTDHFCYNLLTVISKVVRLVYQKLVQYFQGIWNQINLISEEYCEQLYF